MARPMLGTLRRRDLMISADRRPQACEAARAAIRAAAAQAERRAMLDALPVMEPDRPSGRLVLHPAGSPVYTQAPR